ncbi:MAG TPA: hypothetical protein VJA47_02935 [archaeon]|nr:hypothetical protein [archaeon]
MASKGGSQQPRHVSQCRAAKAVFGLLVLIVGLYAVAGDLGALGPKIPVSPWWLLVVIVGLFWLLKSAAGGKCPACR